MPLGQDSVNRLGYGLGSIGDATEIATYLNNPLYDSGNAVQAAAGAVTMAAGQKVCVVNKTVGAATTVTLPPSPAAWQVATVKDGKGDAGTNNITVQAASGNIDGQASLLIKSNFGSLQFLYNGTQWNCINQDFWDGVSDLTVPGALTVLGQSTVAAGGGAGTMKPEGNLSVELSAAGVGTGADTTEDTLFTYSLPASTLDAAGRGLYIRAWGTFAANAHNKTVKLYFGGESFSTGVLTGNNVGWYVELWVFKSASNVQQIQGAGAAGAAHLGTAYQAGAETDTGAITIKVTGTNGTAAANDILANGMLVGVMN